MVSPRKYNHCNGHSKQWRADEDPVTRLAATLHRMPSTCTAATVAMVCTTVLLLLLHPGVRYHANEAAKAALSTGGSPHNSGGAYMRVSSDKKGFCRLEYTVKTWDGKNAPVCDPSLCYGSEKLNVLTNLQQGQNTRRWSAFHESAYMKLFNAKQIDGWLKPRQIAFVKALTAKQHELGIFGSVGEIGVHHGKFLIPIIGNALAGEPAVALDLFEDQSSNVDVSGRGSKAHLLHNLERSGIPENSLTLMPGNSMLLSAKNFTSRGFPAFRLLSVDGGHTLEITLHDMMVASCLVRDGGIVVLDDFPNPSWMGVAEALMHFTHAQDRLVPFLHGANKVWFTTPGHVHVYQDLMASNPTVFSCSKDHVSKQTLAGYKLCWTGYN